MSWDLKIKKKLKTVPLCLGKLRPVVGQRCHQCTPDSLYRGWLARRMCCALFVSGCKVYVSPVNNRLDRICQSNGSLLVYVYVRQSIMDCALIPLVLFCQNLRVPYTLCPLQINSSFLSILQKVGVVLLPPSALTEQDAETDRLYAPVMTSLVRELLHEGQAISVGVSAKSGQGGQWLAHIRQLIKEGSVPDVSLVPVGISYDSLWLWSLLWRRPGGIVRIHFAEPFSFKEMCESWRNRVDEWLPLQDLLLPVILNNTDTVLGQRRMSWLLPPHYASELEPSDPERDLSTVIILHHIFATSCTAVMSTSLVSSLLLYRHRKGVSLSALCRDVVWLTEEVLLKNKDVGFGGSLAEVVHHSLSLLTPHLIIAAVPSCAVSAMLCEVAISGISSRVRSDGVDGDRVRGDMEFDVVLCQSELTERALQLCHLLPPGFMPPCQSSHSFALDAIDSLVRCGILVMEEIPRGVPVCDFWKKEGALSWTTSDDPYHSDSDCGEEELHSYR
uniref:GPAT/DHAPAT C-terminal domain-containing protein n=1 Tax=Monopterus albus TaxID=43700 RepID=A0A3Q3K5B8_MONAL